MFLPIKQSLFTVISVIFVVSGIVLEIFWKDVYHSILAKVCLYFGNIFHRFEIVYVIFHFEIAANGFKF